jgi:adenosyl cobinamide kinase/adenosyl cobinamide phosphate guanylyltransferase
VADRLTLVLGGARSGKSRYAEALITALPPPWIYVATAQALDAEMAVRIDAHRARRGAGWTTVEVPRELAATLAAHAQAPILVDCLTLWLSASCPTMRWRAASAICKVSSTSASRRGPTMWSCWWPDCP